MIPLRQDNLRCAVIGGGMQCTYRWEAPYRQWAPTSVTNITHWRRRKKPTEGATWMHHQCTAMKEMLSRNNEMCRRHEVLYRWRYLRRWRTLKSNHTDGREALHGTKCTTVKACLQIQWIDTVQSTCQTLQCGHGARQRRIFAHCKVHLRSRPSHCQRSTEVTANERRYELKDMRWTGCTWFESHHPEPTACVTVTMAQASVQEDRGQHSETHVRVRDKVGKLSVIELPRLWGENPELHLSWKTLLSLQALEVHTILWIPNTVNTEGEVLAVWCFRPQIDDVLAREEVAVALPLRPEDCIGLLEATVERTDEKCEYPRMQDEWVGAAAIVVREEETNWGMLEWLLPARRVTQGEQRATLMLHCVGPAVPRLLDYLFTTSLLVDSCE